jgi:hypothetical protein
LACFFTGGLAHFLARVCWLAFPAVPSAITVYFNAHAGSRSRRLRNRRLVS